MKTRNINNRLASTLKAAPLAGLALAALILARPASAWDRDYHRDYDRGPDVSGQVEIVRPIPGGVVSVGVQLGRPRPVVVEEPQKVVVVRHEEEYPREVTVVHEDREAGREVIIVKHHGRGRGHEIVERRVIERHDRHDCDWRRDDDDHGWRGDDGDRGHARHVSYVRDDEGYRD